MQIKAPVQAIFFDIDGTLLSYKTHQIPKSTLEGLATLRKKGIKLAVATGRPQYDIDPFRELFEFDAYVSMHGQRCLVDGKLLRAHTFEQEDIRTLISIVQEDDYPCLFVESEWKYATAINDAVRAHFSLIHQPLPPIADISRTLDNDIYQFVIYTTEEKERRLLDALPHIVPLRASPMCLDVIPGGGGKDEGILAVLNHWGIPVEASMAFGDGMNDITMLQFVGTGVAMGNADEPVKAVADFVTTPLEEGGICHAFRYFGLLPTP